MDWSALSEYLPLLLRGAVTTIALSVLALAGGLALGVLVAVVRTLGGVAINRTLGAGVDLLRTTPLLVQMLVWYLGAGAVGFAIDPFPAAVLAMVANSGAFISEIVRGSLLAVPHGQREAAVSVGLTPTYSVMAIEMPQAMPSMLPALIGFYIGMIKDTSLAFILGLLELTRTASSVANQTFRPLETYLLVALMYFAICFPVARLGQYLDRRSRRTGLAQERLFV